jgi:signal transduction histidine kinase
LGCGRRALTASTGRWTPNSTVRGSRGRAHRIHDTLAQGFTSIVALAQAIEPELDKDTTAAKRHVELIRRTAPENLAEARAMAAELTPAALDEGSLPAVIGRQCERLSAETGVAVTMRSDDELPALGMATDVVLLRAAQEAFANVRRHVQASTGTVELSSVAGASEWPWRTRALVL